MRGEKKKSEETIPKRVCAAGIYDVLKKASMSLKIAIAMIAIGVVLLPIGDILSMVFEIGSIAFLVFELRKQLNYMNYLKEKYKLG